MRLRFLAAGLVLALALQLWLRNLRPNNLPRRSDTGSRSPRVLRRADRCDGLEN